MAVTPQLLRYSPLPCNRRISNPSSSIAFPFSSSDPRSQNRSDHFVFPKLTLPKSNIIEKLQSAFSGDDNGNGVGNGGDCGSGGGGKGDSKGQNDNNDGEEEFIKAIGALGRMLSGWVFRWVITGDPVFALDNVIKEMLVWPLLVAFNLGVILQGTGEAIVGGGIMILMALISFEITLGAIFGLFGVLGYFAGISLLVCIPFYCVFATVCFFMGWEF